MSERVVYINGRFEPESEARISIYDSGISSGDMAFDVARTYNQQPFRLEDHIRRLYKTLAAIHVTAPIDQAEMQRLTLETLEHNLPTEADDVDWNIIHNVSAGPASQFRSAFEPDELRPTVLISCFPLLEKMAALAPDYQRGWDLVVPTQRAIPGTLLDPSIKSRSRLQYHLANVQAHAMQPGARAILIDPDGNLTEATNGNLFMIRAGRLFTPRTGNLLAGVTRGVVMELAKDLQLPTEEADLTQADALAAEEMFVTSTTIGVLHARSFAGQRIGDGSAGPVTRKLRHAFESQVGLDFAAQAAEYARRV